VASSNETKELKKKIEGNQNILISIMNHLPIESIPLSIGISKDCCIRGA